MIRYTLFNPLSGRIIATGICSHDEDVWAQVMEGQGVVQGHYEEPWQANGDEGFVRHDDEFYPTRLWLDKITPTE